MRIRALDSIRGLLLLQMTLDHFGRPISYYLYQCFGFFSAAEGFFFLSGFVGILAANSKQVKDPKQSWMRKRCVRIWVYHIATLLFLSLCGLTLFPEFANNFKAIYEHPVSGIIWSALLVNTPEWLDVLPLYVIFLFGGSFLFPLFLKAEKKRQIFFLWLPSLALWIASQYGLRDLWNGMFPPWIDHGFFDPFAWQFLYFTGAAVSIWWLRARTEEANGKPKTVQLIKRITPAAIAIMIFCCLWSHKVFPLSIPSEFWISKDHVGALRFANFGLFTLFICGIVRRFPNLLDFRPCNTLGRHSMDVYTAHIVFVYFWLFAVPGSIRNHGPWNVIIPVAACVLLWVIAKLREPKKPKV